jgi:RNA polymerase sigma-70 factor (ECF subfamily)
VTRRESDRAWRARLEKLPLRYRRAVELRHISGLSYPELAAALERPVGTVKSDVHRGVGLLRQGLRQEALDDADG